jgi:hypothetical protein
MIDVFEHNGQYWIESADLAVALGIEHDEIVSTIADLDRPPRFKGNYFGLTKRGYRLTGEGLLAIMTNMVARAERERSLGITEILRAFANAIPPAAPMTDDFGAEAALFEAAQEARSKASDEKLTALKVEYIKLKAERREFFEERGLVLFEAEMTPEMIGAKAAPDMIAAGYMVNGYVLLIRNDGTEEVIEQPLFTKEGVEYLREIAPHDPDFKPALPN